MPTYMTYLLEKEKEKWTLQGAAEAANPLQVGR